MDTNEEVLEAHKRLVSYWDVNADVTQNWSEVAASLRSDQEGTLVLRVFIEPGTLAYEHFRRQQVMKGADITSLVSKLEFVESEAPVLQ